MASKVTPSLPGAPSFFLASAYASRTVSSLQTWTYSPQNFHDVSAFALTYILRLRSCKSMDAFVISSLPSLWSETLQTAGLLRSYGRYPASTLLRTHPSPSRLRSTSRLSRLYDRPCSDDFSSGRGGLLQLLGMSLSPCCRFHPAEVLEPHRSDFGSPCCLRPPVGGSAFGATHFRGHFCVHCCYGPVTRRLPTGDVVDRLQSLGFPPPCYPNYGVLIFAPAGLSPAEHASLRWTHNRT